MSQSFWGLSNGSNGIGAVAGATGQTYTAPNNVYWEQYEWRGRDLQSWQKRAIDGGGSASAEIDQQLFCLVSGESVRPGRILKVAHENHCERLSLAGKYSIDPNCPGCKFALTK